MVEYFRAIAADQSKRGHCSLKFVEIEKGATAPRSVPKCIVLNARSLAKVDAAPALQTELICNKIDICFISES